MRDIFEMIAVRPPYCALEEPVVGQGSVVASVKRSHPMKRETGAIAAAEVGRHLAIAGAVAVATENPSPGKHFYLARGARIERIGEISASPEASETFRVQAVSERIEKRQAAASAALSVERDGGWQDLYRIRVEYEVIAPSIFARMTRALPKMCLDGGQEADVFSLPLDPVLDEAGDACAVLKVLPEYCFGHFPEYPAFPVAKLMHLLSTLAGEHLSLRLDAPDLRYSVERADVSAERLAFAGSEVALRSQYVRREADGTHHLLCEALVDESLCGSMDLFLREQ